MKAVHLSQECLMFSHYQKKYVVF